MESLVKWLKEKWILVLGGFGIIVVALGAIFGRKKIADDKTVSFHENRIDGLNSARQIENAAQESILKAEKEAANQNVAIEQEKLENIKTLESKEQSELTAVVADRFNFKNGDKQ